MCGTILFFKNIVIQQVDMCIVTKHPLDVHEYILIHFNISLFLNIFYALTIY